MKKILFYALAACATLSVGCSKDAGIDQEVVADGKYTLPEITASLDDAETRTELGTNQVVNWENNDRLAVINTTTNTIYYYVLASGANTPVGKFEPVVASKPATFTDISEIKAVYPAVAAYVEGGEISVAINTEPTDDHLGKTGTTSWTPNSSKYAFKNNDIKVSYSTSMETTDDAKAQVNFKFRQLATWCTFDFNFSGTDAYKYESMEKFVVRSSSKGISGKAKIDFTGDPMKPKLIAGSDSEQSIELKARASLGGSFSMSLMLFPTIEGTEDGTKTGDQLQFEVTTSEHKLTFYATPSTNLAAGTVLRFPFNVGDNFTEATAAAEFKYVAEPLSNLPDFYYYGKANCMLVDNSATSGSIDITPHKTNTYYWFDKNAPKDTDAPEPKSANLIWKETTLTGSITCSISGNTLTVNNLEGNGNALVGIYDSSNNLLWSYHIWKPEIDPTAESNVLTYDYTNSGTYTVMPIALGATNVATVTVGNTASDATNAKSFGLYYQWGRKDPMGRPSKVNAGAGDFVAAVDGGGTEFKFDDANHEKELQSILGLGDKTTVETMKLDDKEDGVDVPVDYYMINYVRKNPTVFIMENKNINSANYNWTGKDNPHLWGNPQGYNYPRQHEVNRSIFDPCPEGWRVAPKDLWIAFTKSGGTMTANAADESTWAENILNVANINTSTHVTTFDKEKGYFFHYQQNPDNGNKMWRTGKTDFYPASGFRNLTNGSVTSVGSSAYCWSSSPYSTGHAIAGSLAFTASTVYPLYYNNRAYGFTVRCVREEK